MASKLIYDPILGKIRKEDISIKEIKSIKTSINTNVTELEEKLRADIWPVVYIDENGGSGSTIKLLSDEIKCLKEQKFCTDNYDNLKYKERTQFVRVYRKQTGEYFLGFLKFWFESNHTQTPSAVIELYTVQADGHFIINRYFIAGGAGQDFPSEGFTKHSLSSTALRNDTQLTSFIQQVILNSFAENAETYKSGFLNVTAGKYDITFNKTNNTIKAEIPDYSDYFLYFYSTSGNEGDLGQFRPTDNQDIYIIPRCNIPKQGIKFCVRSSDWNEIFGHDTETIEQTDNVYQLKLTNECNGWLNLPAGEYKVTFDYSNETVKFENLSYSDIYLYLHSIEAALYNMQAFENTEDTELLTIHDYDLTIQGIRFAIFDNSWTQQNGNVNQIGNETLLINSIGNIGPQGIQGIQGQKGIPGAQGSQGLPGADGNNGVTPLLRAYDNGTGYDIQVSYDNGITFSTICSIGYGANAQQEEISENEINNIINNL